MTTIEEITVEWFKILTVMDDKETISVDSMVRIISNILGCAEKDVWEKIGPILHNAGAIEIKRNLQ